MTRPRRLSQSGHLSLTIRDRDALSRAMELLTDAIPISLRRWLAGPHNLARISAQGSTIERWVGKWRPTEIVVAPDLVLEKPLSIPPGARADLRSAIELLIRSQTPFEPGELVVAATARRSATFEASVTYDLILLPLALVKDAIRRHGLRRAGKARVERSGSPAVRLPLSSGLGQIWTRLVWLLPVAIALIALLASFYLEDARRTARVASLSRMVEDELASLRTLSDERDVLSARQAGADRLQQTVRSTPSPAAVLSAVRSTLSEATELIRIELRDGVYRFSLKTENALEETRLVAAAFAGWSAAPEGAITRDAGNARDSIVIALAPRPAE